MWNYGDIVALRGMIGSRPWIVQSCHVVKDTPQEIALLLLPDAECIIPESYLHRKHDPGYVWERWQESRSETWKQIHFRWLRNRMLMLLEPQKYYATIYIWEHATNIFQCYYINFQLPFTRSHCGFDTLDLDLDIVIQPDLTWQWKDVDEYERGIQADGILPDWMHGIDQAKPEIFDRIEKRKYPLDGAWLDWKPDPAWTAPTLPDGWNLP
jgi:protein associated with RNAse G/E